MGPFLQFEVTMAYSSVRVQFEIGHEASVRTKKTPEGFTHDWEVFVRGADNTDIQCFVDKVVFHLHETFPKPRRVIKEPPYVVKESGYAGFVLPIDVYLKNKEEPKKISFQYDLTLQSSGPPISRVLREPRLFQNPSEDFRRKLIRGGGVGVDTPSEPLTEDLKSAPSISQNKPKLVDSPAKKHKLEQPLNHSFAELFGTPIRRVPEPKKLREPSKKVEDKNKPSKPYKDDKEIIKEKYAERSKSKEKLKRPSSPSLPLPTGLQVKSKDEHKKHEERERKKEEEKKKRKEEKDRKEKPKELDRQLEKELKKDKKESRDGDYSKKLNSKPPDVKPNYEKQNNEGPNRDKERLEKEKHKHRHKKKEKEKNRDKEKHRKEKEKELREKEKNNKKKLEETREKEEKRKKSRSPSPVQIKKGPLNALLDELGSSDSASPLSEDESIPPVKSLLKPPAKIVPETKSLPLANVTPKSKSTNSNESAPKPEDANISRSKKEKSSSKKNKKSERDTDKKKEKEEFRGRSVSSERAEKEEGEEVKERGSHEDRSDKDRQDEDKLKPKDKENRKRKREKSEETQTKSKKNDGSQSGAVEGSDGGSEELRRPDKFTKEYVAQLKDLQHRIMTLEDNAELQKVVKVIAETGQYEVTKKTFDFDLCALDMETVKRLQEFFAPT